MIRPLVYATILILFLTFPAAAHNFGVVLDTFLDRRNAYYFQTNAIGALRDASVTEGLNNPNWNTVWDVRTARSDTGYTLEMAIPFKSLRYRGAGPQTWGINVRRVVKWKNEDSMLSQVPASFSGGWTQMAVAGTLVGLETPAQALNLELKPYGVSSLTTDRAARVPFNNDTKSSAGFDLKYGLTRGLTADLTVNTDFAQVEEDLQQVNLTRFDLFYPDKRDFFLEGQGVFDFGGQTDRNAVRGLAVAAPGVQHAHTVQSERPFPHVQCAHALGVHARQRPVRRLQRRPRHRRRKLSGPAEPILRDQGHAPVSIVSLPT